MATNAYTKDQEYITNKLHFGQVWVKLKTSQQQYLKNNTTKILQNSKHLEHIFKLNKSMPHTLKKVLINAIGNITKYNG